MKKKLIPAVIIFIGLIIMLQWLEKRMIDFPTKYPVGTWQPKGLKI